MERLQPSKKWIEKYENVKMLLKSPINYAECFEKTEIQGVKVFVLDMGEVNFPSGEILVRDPLVWLGRSEKPYLQTVPIGTYRIETLVAEMDENHYRYAMSRIKFTEEKPVIYY